jgi:hypothetical protein
LQQHCVKGLKTGTGNETGRLGWRPLSVQARRRLLADFVAKVGCCQGDDRDETRFHACGLVLILFLVLILSPMNEFAVNLAPEFVDDGYLKILVVGKAFIEKMLCDCFAMCNRVGIGFELQSNPIPHGDAVFHVKEKFLHSRQPWFVLLASQFLFLNNTRSNTATCRC